MSTIALITGGNRGLGLATATALARTGATVIIAGRDLEAVRCAADGLLAEGLRAEPLMLDVASPASVAEAADEIGERHGHLDILVNNAGILPEASARGDHDFVDLAAFASTFETNVLGVATVTEKFLPLLRRSTAGRIVNVSSTMGSLSDQSDESSPYYSSIVPAYQASKAAVNSMTIGLSKQLAGTPLKVTSVCPGWVQTDLAPGNRDQAPTSADEAARIVVTAATLPDHAESGTFISSGGAVAW
ncbi:SDR family NAD(P)-dependent oxidoreductase [Agromyces sp. NPDC056965]|uniref:SDR family NAD(P)-dependent oxidoreductase n=1 Tax=Agromyces sp. NPDC056965 TaxID=3345983 RepID=UPI00363BA909